MREYVIMPGTGVLRSGNTLVGSTVLVVIGLGKAALLVTMLKLRRHWSVGDEDAGLCSKKYRIAIGRLPRCWLDDELDNGRNNAEQHRSFPLFFFLGGQIPLFGSRGSGIRRKLGCWVLMKWCR